MVMTMWVKGTVVASIVIAIKSNCAFHPSISFHSISFSKKALASSSSFILHLIIHTYIQPPIAIAILKPIDTHPRKSISCSLSPPDHPIVSYVPLISLHHHHQHHHHHPKKRKNKKEKEGEKPSSEFFISNFVMCVCACSFPSRSSLLPLRMQCNAMHLSKGHARTHAPLCAVDVIVKEGKGRFSL